MNLKPALIEIDSREFLERLDPHQKLKRFFELLMEENRRVNLVSRETSSDNLNKLAIESLIPFEIFNIKGVDSYLDIGSGGGFPALPVILTKNIKMATLLERTKKKASALNRMIVKLGLKAEVIPEDFDNIVFKEQVDLITLRLIKLTDPLFEKIDIILKEKGTFVYYSKLNEISDFKNYSLFTCRFSIDNQMSPITLSVLKKNKQGHL